MTIRKFLAIVWESMCEATKEEIAATKVEIKNARKNAVNQPQHKVADSSESEGISLFPEHDDIHNPAHQSFHPNHIMYQ